MTVPVTTQRRKDARSLAPVSRWSRWIRRWPEWAPAAAVAWCAVYAAVQAARVGKGTSLPFPLPAPYAALAQLTLATLAVVAAAACLVSRRPLGRPGRRAVSCALILTTPAFALGMTVLPIYAVPLASGSGLESVTGLAHALLSTALTCCLVLVGLSYRRRLAGACPRCGHRHTGGHDAPLVHPGASTASRRTRKRAYLLVCGVLPWAGVKTVWTLGGDALGITAEKWRESNSGGSELSKALASVGIDVTVLAAGLGIFLLVGLLHPWGQVFPRWTLLLSGHRVPRLLPLIPAWLTTVGLSAYGIFLLLYAPLAALGVVPAPEPDPELGGTPSGTLWLVAFGGMAFGGLGLALLTAARSYSARTRPTCATATTPAE